MVSGDGTVIVLEAKLIWMVYDCAVHLVVSGCETAASFSSAVSS